MRWRSWLLGAGRREDLTWAEPGRHVAFAHLRVSSNVSRRAGSAGSSPQTLQAEFTKVASGGESESVKCEWANSLVGQMDAGICRLGAPRSQLKVSFGPSRRAMRVAAHNIGKPFRGIHCTERTAAWCTKVRAGCDWFLRITLLAARKHRNTS
jgi:hypothetical protein